MLAFIVGTVVGAALATAYFKGSAKDVAAVEQVAVAVESQVEKK